MCMYFNGNLYLSVYIYVCVGRIDNIYLIFVYKYFNNINYYLKVILLINI